MPSKNFYEILDAIEDTTTRPSWAIQGRYDGDDPADDPRKFLAYLLGGDKRGGNGDEAVLGYQYDGPHTSQAPHPSPQNWRCLKVESFVEDEDIADPDLTVKRIPFDGVFTPPNPLTNGEVDRQNCVLGGVPGCDRKRRTEPYYS